MKSLRSTLILLVIVAVVGGYIYFNERGPIAESGSVVLMRINPAQVQAVRLKNAGHSEITLAKTGGQWTVKHANLPVVAADPDAVKSLLDGMQLIQVPSTLPDTPDKLKEYGLDVPRSTLVVDESTISFGKRPPFDSARVYARIQSPRSTQVALVPSSLSAAASQPFDVWRDKAILRIKVDDLARVELQAPSINATFEKAEMERDSTVDSWRITKPLQAKANDGIIQSFLEQLPQTKSTSFLDDAPKSLVRWGLDKPRATISLAGATTNATLRIGKRLNAGYAAQNSLSPTVFEVPASLFALINRPLIQWRARQLLSFEMDRLTQVEINARGQKLRFQNDGEKWIHQSGSTPADAQAQHQAVLDILLGAQGLNVQKFIDHPQPVANYALDKPALQLSLFSSQWSGAKSVSIGTKTTNIYARLTGGTTDKTIYMLMPTTMGAFKPALNILFSEAKPK